MCPLGYNGLYPDPSSTCSKFYNCIDNEAISFVINNQIKTKLDHRKIKIKFIYLLMTGMSWWFAV